MLRDAKDYVRIFITKTISQISCLHLCTDLSDDVQWEFKWKETDTEIHGPHSSQSMLDWQENGYFSDGVLVRKLGTEEFRDSKRIDFDIYI